MLVQVVLSKGKKAHLTRLRLSVREIARCCACEMPFASVLGCESRPVENVGGAIDKRELALDVIHPAVATAQSIQNEIRNQCFCYFQFAY